MSTPFKAIRNDHRRIRGLLREAADAEVAFARARARLKDDTLVASTLHADLEAILQRGSDGSARQVSAALTLIQSDRLRVDNALADLTQLGQALAVERVERLATLRSLLSQHGELEEAVLYPALAAIGLEELLVAVAIEEHHVVDALLDELASTEPLDLRFEARWRLMSQAVEGHIRDEERRLLGPAARQAAPEDLMTVDQAIEEAQGMLDGAPSGLRVSFFEGITTATPSEGG